LDEQKFQSQIFAPLIHGEFDHFLKLPGGINMHTGKGGLPGKNAFHRQMPA